MIKTVKTLFKQDKEKFAVPKSVQAVIPLKTMWEDDLDKYRKEYSKMLLDKATGAHSTMQDKYVTVSVCKKNIEEARNYFARVGADLIRHFNRLGSKCAELDANDKLRIFHGFYRTGGETAFSFEFKKGYFSP